MMKSNYIILLVCILFGLQSPIAAQSSDWVYSPYAQYLTNDTTIPPPVGEPADAALSCFRHDTIYVLVMPTGQLYIWLRPDPLLDKYINMSPYAYCNGNPLKYVDPEGDAVAVFIASKAVYNLGHMALAVQDSDGNWHFYSKNGDGKCSSSSSSDPTSPNDIGLPINSPEEFINSDIDNTVRHDGEGGKYYDEYIIIPTIGDQDCTIEEEMERQVAEIPYNVLTDNCTQAVQRALQKGGIDVGEETPIPNDSMESIKQKNLQTND